MTDTPPAAGATRADLRAEFAVSTDTIRRWERDDRYPISADMRTTGGHVRYPAAAVEELRRVLRRPVGERLPIYKATRPEET